VFKCVYILNMKFRAARHTSDLKPIIGFYQDILGLTITGEFKGHNGYDGVFLGDKNANWELEFTVSNDVPYHHFDEDDLLVFYPSSIDEFDAVMQKIATHNIEWQEPKNPYWKQNGIMVYDPDGSGVIIVIPK